MFRQIFTNQFKNLDDGTYSTRSSKILLELHQGIAELVEKNSTLTTLSMREKEYNYTGIFTPKKLDVALFNNDKIKAAIQIKAIRSEYLKNSNNYFENMLGESFNLLLSGIAVYQIILIPSRIRLGGKRIGQFEILKPSHLEKYNRLLENSIHPNFKLGLWVFDVDYDDYKNTQYSDLQLNGQELTLEEGVLNFLGGING